MQIVRDLEELRIKLLLAESTTDKRRCDKCIREAKTAIADYARSLPSEVLGYLDTKVASSALNYQWVRDDIGPCIKALKEWADTLTEEA